MEGYTRCIYTDGVNVASPFIRKPFQRLSGAMRLIFLAAFLASVLVLSGANRCYSHYDCKEEGTCCTGGISPYIKGSCQDLAREGEKCDPNPPDTGKYFLHCPCDEGLNCASETVQEGDAVIMKTPTCKRP